MKKILIPLLLWCVALPLGAAGPVQPTNAAASKPKPDVESLFGQAVIAKGKGVSVTRGQLDEEVIRIRSAAATRGGQLPPDLEQEVLDGLISKQLILDQATAADRAKGKELYASAIRKIKTARKLSDTEFEQRLKPQLQLMGLTREEWEQQNVDQATLPVVVERELKIAATDDEARKYYKDYPARFEQPEMVRVAYILLTTRDPRTGQALSEEQAAAKKKQLEQILKQARDGADFAKLAKTYSEDPNTKDEGGELPPFPRGQPGVPPEFEAAAFALNTNQVSDIITSPAGYSIIKVYEKMPAKTLSLDDKLMADIKDYLNQAEVQKQLPTFVTKLRKEADVQILDPKLKLESQAGPPPGSAPAVAPPPAKP
jgi:parvulin-like peptidyl-prolyl isomerase